MASTRYRCFDVQRFTLLCRRGVLVLAAAAATWCTGVLPAQTDPFSANIRPTPPLAPAEELRSFRLPEGFRITCFASEPMIHKPLNMAFDLRGRLWLTETVEYPFPAPPNRVARDRIRILEDTDGDGVADRAITFADGLNIPIGICPYGRGAIVFSIPDILYLEDVDGDGKADRRTRLYGPFDFSRDTHGLNNSFRRSFDGWIYACHGFNNRSTVSGRDGHSITLVSGNVYRFRPDGSRIELVTTGQVNPFGMAIDEWGDIYTADCHSKPLTHLIPGGCYQSFGRPHNGLGFAPEMMSHLHGSTAIAGVVYLDSPKFPREFQRHLLSGNVMTSRVNHDRIEQLGATLQAREMPDFVSTSDPWFRPVDLRLGPDGALYVADFYNRIIGHYEVPLDHPGRDRFRGRIWRIVPLSADGSRRARTSGSRSQASVHELLKLLDAAQTNVRLLALNELVDHHRATVGEKIASVWSRASARMKTALLWAEFRAGGNRIEADSHVFAALEDGSPLVRGHAWKVVREAPNWPEEAVEDLRQGVADGDPRVRMAAVLASERHPRFERVPMLLACLKEVPSEDAELRYGLKMALRSAMSLPGAFPWLRMQLRPKIYRTPIAEVALAIPSAESAEYLWRCLQADRSLVGDEALKHIVQHGPEPLGRQAIRTARQAFRGLPEQEAPHWVLLATAWRSRGVGKLPAELDGWARELMSGLVRLQPRNSVAKRRELAAELVRLGSTAQLVSTAAEELRSQAEPLTKSDGKLLLVIAGAKRQPYLRALTPLLYQPEASPQWRRRVRDGLFGSHERVGDIDEAMLVRVLRESPASVQLSVAQAAASHVVSARVLANELLKEQLPDALLQDRVIQQQFLALLPMETIKPLKDRLDRMQAGNDLKLIKQASQLVQSFRKTPGNANRGKVSFQKHCASCHQIGNEGAVIGPQLDGIGTRGVARLFEDVVDPNRNVDPQFRTVLLRMDDGRVITGLLRHKEETQWVLADQEGKEFTVDVAEIEEVRKTTTSLMPVGLVETIGHESLNDIIAFLLTQMARQER